MRLQSMSHVLVAAALSSAMVLSPTVAHADPPPEVPRSVYRIEVSITGIEEGPHAAPATYTLILLENQGGTIATGANIPLSVVPTGAGSTPAPRVDVGLNLHLSYSLRGSVVLVAGGMEMSTADAPTATTAATIHRVRIDGVTPVTPGTPALFGRVFDINSRRHYEMTVSAQRLL